MTEQPALFDVPVVERVEQPMLPMPVQSEYPDTGHKKPNPLIALYGLGPVGVQCCTCSHYYTKRYDKVYRKCDLRKETNGPGSDHRARWQACGRYEKRIGEYHGG